MGDATGAGSHGPRDFEEFYRGSYHDLVRWAMYSGVMPDRAEDIVEEAMAGMLLRWPEIERRDSYAHRAVINNVINEKNRDKNRRLAEAGYAPHSESVEDGGLNVWEDEQWVAQVLSCLEPSQRAVIEGVLAELTSAEIGKLLGKTDFNVRKILSKARLALREHLEEIRRRDRQEGSREEEVR